MTTQPPSIAKPVAVTRAIGLLYFSLGIFFGYSLWRSFGDFSAVRDIFFFLMPMAWLIYKTNQGRNWARTTFLALYVFGTVISIPVLLLTAQDSINSIIDVGVVGFSILQAALQAVALFMLFSSDARLWFWAVSNQPPVHVTGNLEYRRLVLLGISGAMISCISLVVLTKATEAQYSESKIGK